MYFSRNCIASIAIIIVIENCILYAPAIELKRLNWQPILKERTQVDWNNLWDKYGGNEGISGLSNSLVPDIFSQYLNVSKYAGEECNRACRKNDIRLCYFKFVLEYFHAMGTACGQCDKGVTEDCNNRQCIVGDGWRKGVMSINRKSPGPPIHVCKDDIVVVDVHNAAHGSLAALHWHGVHMKDTPFMDGLPFVTQCPIPFATTFRYKFRATETGTQFYHSHSGHHKANGQYGALIIRQPTEMETFTDYDHDLPEHYIYIADWMHMYAEQHFPGLGRDGIFPDSLTINGRGVYFDPETTKRTKVPPTIYYVTAGQRYRFRLINGISHICPIQFQIEKHDFSIIASDSFELHPQIFDTLVSNSGERYDFILSANHTSGDFWIRVKTMGFCNARILESYALIRYNTGYYELPIPEFPNYDEQYPIKGILNHPNDTSMPQELNTQIIELVAAERDQELFTGKPDHQFFLAFNNYEVPQEEVYESGQYFHFTNPLENISLVGAINNISLVFPHFPPLTQPELIDESDFCDRHTKPKKCEGQRLCHCTHRIKVKLNSIVELIIVDETRMINNVNHPFHMHGYRFMVTGMGQDPEGIPMTVQRARNLDIAKLLKRCDSPAPAFKDTVSIPSRGYAVVRLRATNPGFWLMHCHYDWHLSIGMGLLFQVGETYEMVKAPFDFPKCGNFMPKVRSSDINIPDTHLLPDFTSDFYNYRL